MTHYSRTGYIDNPEVTCWNNIELSPKTVYERNKIKWGIDDFASFTWRGIDAFKTFGAFIINNKNNLKFYNGPSFSNEYTKPQFETAAGQLTGVTFQTQKIDFSVGVYWISEEDYRQMIYWLHPYEINTLTFGFEPNYYYQVKLSSIDNSNNRYIVGYEDNKPMYYTEIKVAFELQGAPVAYGNTYFEFKQVEPNNRNFYQNENRSIDCYTVKGAHDSRTGSNLETPIIIQASINLAKIKTSNSSVETTTESDLSFSATAQYEGEDVAKLFEVTFKNLNFGEHIDGTENKLNITYNSDTALLFLQHGDSMRELLTKLTTLTTGDRIIDTLSVEQFRIPGQFDDYLFNLENMTIHYQLNILNNNFVFDIPVNNASVTDFLNIQVLSRPRTNLI